MNVNSDEEMLRFRTNQTKEIRSFQQEKKVNKLMQPRTIVKNKKNRMIEIVKKKPEE
jgi:hypothetical protein